MIYAIYICHLCARVFCEDTDLEVTTKRMILSRVVRLVMETRRF